MLIVIFAMILKSLVLVNVIRFSSSILNLETKCQNRFCISKLEFKKISKCYEY